MALKNIAFSLLNQTLDLATKGLGNVYHIIKLGVVLGGSYIAWFISGPIAERAVRFLYGTLVNLLWAPDTSTWSGYFWRHVTFWGIEIPQGEGLSHWAYQNGNLFLTPLFAGFTWVIFNRLEARWSNEPVASEEQILPLPLGDLPSPENQIDDEQNIQPNRSLELVSQQQATNIELSNQAMAGFYQQAVEVVKNKKLGT